MDYKTNDSFDLEKNYSESNTPSGDEQPCRFCEDRPRKMYSLWLYVIPLLILFIAYYPSFAPFGLHNDYSFLEPATRDWWLRYEESWLLCRVGRPVAGLLMSCQMLFMKSSASFVYWRIAAVVMSTILAWQFASLLLSRTTCSPEQCMLWGTLFLLTPAAQLSVVWVTMMSLGLVASAIGLLAYRMMPDICETFSLKNLVSSFRRHLSRYMITILILVLAMLIYPINALLGLVITAAIVLSDRTVSEKICVVVRDGIVFGASMAIYFILIKSKVLPLAEGENLLSVYQIKPSFSPVEALKNMTNILGISFASPWHTITGMSFGIALNLALLCVLIILLRKIPFTRLTEVATVALLLLVVLLVANAPVLVAPKGFYNAYRTGLASQAIVWVLVGSAISKIAVTRKLFSRSLLFGIVAAALICTQYNCILVKTNCYKELAYIRTAVSFAISEKRDLVYLLKARTDPSAGLPPRFEFALPITHATHLLGALSGQSDVITASGINIGAVDENGDFRQVYGVKPQDNAIVCDMALMELVFNHGARPAVD